MSLFSHHLEEGAFIAMVPTIHDVAKLANTSKSTVSRYLNGQKVKKTTQVALDRAIRELNFHRNAHARRLVTSKTFTIGIAIDDISNVFYSGMIKGIEDAVKKKAITASITAGHRISTGKYRFGSAV